MKCATVQVKRGDSIVTINETDLVKGKDKLATDEEIKKADAVSSAKAGKAAKIAEKEAE